MKDFRWNELKSARLKRTRGVSFEEIAQAKWLDAREHPTRPGQRIMLFEYRGYVWVVPYVKQDNDKFLKTLYPSRKYTRLYRRGELI